MSKDLSYLLLGTPLDSHFVLVIMSSDFRRSMTVYELTYKTKH